MNNRIASVVLDNRSLHPASAEIWVAVRPERLTPSTELRGRLMGPRCPYANTIEVAYHLRPLPREEDQPPEFLHARVVIPEASLWDPQSPFLYQGPLELWQEGERCDRTVICHGLRQITLTPKGLCINGKSTSLRGVRCARTPDDEELLALRARGVNLLFAPVVAALLSLWEKADRLGFLVLGALPDTEDATLAQVRLLTQRPSTLGWVLDENRLVHCNPTVFSGALLGIETRRGEAPAESSPVQLLIQEETLSARNGNVLGELLVANDHL